MTLPVRRGNDIARWDPWRELSDLNSRMNDLVGSMFGTLPTLTGGSSWSLPVDVEDTDDAFLIEADLPGMRTEDVNLEVRDNELAISGEVKERERTGILRHRTRRYGTFDYRVSLPGDVEPDKIEAKLGDGVLSVRVPKTVKAQPKRIPITAG